MISNGPGMRLQRVQLLTCLMIKNELLVILVDDGAVGSFGFLVVEGAAIKELGVLAGCGGGHAQQQGGDEAEHPLW